MILLLFFLFNIIFSNLCFASDINTRPSLLDSSVEKKIQSLIKNWDKKTFLIYRKSFLYFYKKKYKKSIFFLKKLYKKKLPIHDDIIFYLGKSYFAIKSYRQAQFYFEKIIYSYPRSRFLIRAFEMQLSLLSGKKLFRAIKKLSSFTKNIKNSKIKGLYLYQLASLWNKSKQSRRALSYYISFLKTYFPYIKFYYDRKKYEIVEEKINIINKSFNNIRRIYSKLPLSFSSRKKLLSIFEDYFFYDFLNKKRISWEYENYLPFLIQFIIDFPLIKSKKDFFGKARKDYLLGLIYYNIYFQEEEKNFKNEIKKIKVYEKSILKLFNGIIKKTISLKWDYSLGLYFFLEKHKKNIELEEYKNITLFIEKQDYKTNLSYFWGTLAEIAYEKNEWEDLKLSLKKIILTNNYQFFRKYYFLLLEDKKYDLLKDILSKSLPLIGERSIRSEFLYWNASILLHLKEYKLAEALFLKSFLEYEGYYGYRAFTFLIVYNQKGIFKYDKKTILQMAENRKAQFWKEKKFIKAYKKTFPVDYSLKSDKNDSITHRLYYYYYLGAEKSGKRQRHYFIDYYPPEDRYKHYRGFTYFFYYLKYYKQSIQHSGYLTYYLNSKKFSAEGGNYCPPDLIFYNYPLLYERWIYKYSQKYNINPFYIMGLIKQESLFDPNAVSHMKANGLMQVIYPTARQIEKSLSLKRKSLFNPQHNIHLGVYYIYYLKKKFKNSDIYALAGYNGGPTNMIRWLEKAYNKDSIHNEDHFVERIIHIEETQNYVKKVMVYYFSYLRTYDQM